MQYVVFYFSIRPDADQHAKHKAYRMAERLEAVKGHNTDVKLTKTAEEALLAASLQAPSRNTLQDESSEEEVKESVRIHMPYDVPEKRQHDADTLKEDLSLKAYVPMSDYRWYSKVGFCQFGSLLYLIFLY